MWWRRMRFTLGYMAREVAVKGAISGALWIMYWYYLDSVVGEGIGEYIGMVFFGLFGMIFGSIVGVMTGLGIGVVYVIANGAFLRNDMHLRFYRYALMAIGGLLTLLSWGPFWLGVEPTHIWMPLSGGLMAAAGVAASAYTYLPDYIDRVRYGRLYDPYDTSIQPDEYTEDPFA